MNRDFHMRNKKRKIADKLWVASVLVRANVDKDKCIVDE